LSPIVAAVAVGGIGLALLGLDRLAGRIVRPSFQSVSGSASELGADLGVEHEELVIASGDHELHAWLLCPGDPHPDEPLFLIAHGWGANHGVVLRLAEPLARRGHDVLFFDIRGHGQNPRVDVVTVKGFRDDVLAVVSHAARRFPDRPLVLIGHSMGGAAGVIAVADGAPVDGLILIAAPSDILDVTAEYLTDHGMPGRLLVNVLRPFFWRRIGGTFRPLTPTRRIAEIDVPLLMIQPEHDRRVARHHADRLAAAAGIPYQLIEGEEHTEVLEAPETLRLIEDFLDRI